IDRASFEINGRALRAQMKAHRSQREHLFKYCRQQMLPGVLLHVIEASSPVDRALGVVGGYRGSDAVRNAVFLVLYFDDGHTVDRSEVEGLPAGCRIEGRAVEVQRRAIGRSVDDTGSEVA